MQDDDDDHFDARPTPPGQFTAQKRPTPDEVVRHRKTVPGGTPVVVMGDAERAYNSRPHRRPTVDYSVEDITSPRAVFDFERPDYATQIAELAMQLRRSGVDPIVAAAALSVSLHRAKEREQTGQRELNKKLEEFLRVQPGGAKFAQLENALAEIEGDISDLRDRTPGEGRFDDLAKAVTSLETAMVDLAPVRRLTRWIIGSFVIVAVAIGGWLYTRGGSETETRFRIQSLEDRAGKIERQLERIESRLERLTDHDNQRNP